jgi:hypothetical protein
MTRLSRTVGHRYRLLCSLSVVPLAALAAGLSSYGTARASDGAAIHSASAEEPAEQRQEEEALFGRWMAAGSGCRADSVDKTVKNDVQLVSAEYNPQDPKFIKVTFSLPDFRLRPLEQKPGKPQVSGVNYARECALRFNLNPPEGKKIKSASAETEIEVSKDKDVKLFVAGSLKLGATTLTQQQTQFPNAESFRFRRHPLLLVPGKNPTDEVPQVDCGEKKIVGVDLTLLTNKPVESNLAEARVFGNGNVTINIELEDCPKVNGGKK